MAARKSNARRGSRKNASTGIPAWFWLLGGILIGLGTAVALMFRGYLPEFKAHAPAIDKPAKSVSSKALITENEPEPEKPRFDFFTVLPEMEVVVPEQELQRKAESKAAANTKAVSDTGTGNNPSTNSPAAAAEVDRYILQVGSFQNAAEADQMKAQLAMIGFTASVQTVTVNGQSWHRIRVGPFEGAREAEDMRRMLADNQFAPLVMKAKP